MRRTERLMSHGLIHTANASDYDLTRLELIGLTLAANGLAVQEIALRLNVSDSEIETLLSSTECKLGAKNRLNAVAIAIQRGLIGIEV